MLTEVVAAICPIAMMTFTSPDLDAVRVRYETHLSYEVRAEGEISAELAESWGTPNVAGRPYILLGPESGARTYLRVVEAPPTQGFEPLRSYGWSTAEIIVQDTYTLSHALRGSPFVQQSGMREIQLDFSQDIINFRVVGPDGEALYLTQLDGDVPNMPFARAKSFVDQVIMTLVTTRDPRASQIFYEDLFRVPGTSPFRMGGGDNRLHVIMLPGGCLQELDGSSSRTTERPRIEGELPPGMAMATYYVDSLDRDDLTWVVPPRAYSEAPYGTRRAATVVGPSGELIELVELKMP